jgi:hypothetical protein
MIENAIGKVTNKPVRLLHDESNLSLLWLDPW